MAQGLPILVVEDDPNLREAVCDTLELAGQAVLSAAGGEEALRVLEIANRAGDTMCRWLGAVIQKM